MPRHDPDRWNVLATYNAERARGIRHTKSWRTRMAAEQAAFDAEQRERMMATHREIAPGVWWPRDSPDVIS